MSVPLFDTTAPLAPFKERLGERALAVLESGRYILGTEVEAFEREFANYLGVAHAVGVGNGTDALTIALRALGVGPGDDVIVPSFSFYASAEAIVPTGARPVFCEIDPATFCATADTVRAALTKRTKAVIAVHLFGNLAPVEEIAALGVPVVEDAAQAAGSELGDRKAGTLGTIATFSFFPSKNLGGFGDGGAIATDDAALAERAELLRRHGSSDKQRFEHIGYNSRLDELQAALLRVLLPELDRWTQARREAAAYYESSALTERLTLPSSTTGGAPAWHMYITRHPEAERLIASLREQQIGCAGLYRTPIHRQPAMAEFAQNVSLPVTDEVAATNIALPFGTTITRQQQDEAIETISESLG